MKLDESEQAKQTDIEQTGEMQADASSCGPQLFYDVLFRKKQKRGRLSVVEAPVLEGPVADTHAHTHLLPDPALAFARAAAHGVTFICNVLDIQEDDPRAFDAFDDYAAQAAEIKARLAQREESAFLAKLIDEAPLPAVRTIVGCHPHNARHYTPQLEDQLLERLADPRVCALGEIGLDYHYDFSPRESQREAFRRQLQIAKQMQLPVCLHLREAHDEAFRIMQEEGFPAEGTLLHCCALPWDELRPWVEKGCYIAYGGAIGFASSEEARKAACRVPLDRLLTETDAPYMAPVPMRGMTCEPAHVIFTAARLAEVRGAESGEPRSEFFEQLMRNAQGLLNRNRR